MTNVAVQITGFDELKAWISETGRKLITDQQVVLEKIAGRIANEAVAERFTFTKTAPDGSKWPGLSDKPFEKDGKVIFPGYKTRKLAAKGTENLLIWSGGLRDSVEHGADAMTAWIAAGGAEVPYAAVQNFGWPDRNIPAREFLGVGKEEEKIIASEVERWIREAFKP
jgi:phage gpG-like protein